MKSWIALLVGLLLLLFSWIRLDCDSCRGKIAAPAAAIPVTAPVPVAAAEVDLSARVSAEYGERVTLRGRLPDQASHDRLLAAARAQYGDRVVDSITIDPKVSHDPWLDTAALLAVLKTNGAPSSSFNGSALRLEGEVDSEATRTRIVTEAIALIGAQGTVENALTVRVVSAAESRIAAIMKLQNVEFVSNRNTMTARGETVMNDVLTALQAAGTTRWEVGGHTDGRGDAKINVALSEARANAVVEWLVSHGLDRARFTPRGYGASKPIADDSTASGRQRNRRIEFTQIGGQ